MSRVDEWLKNLFEIFRFHDKPGPPARFDKNMEEHGKEQITGRGEGSSGGYKVVSEKAGAKIGNPSPFNKGGGGM